MKPVTPKAPTLTPVKSSNVAATAYDPATQTLHVQFKGGKTYAYTGVPQEVHTAMGKTDSIGKFVGAAIVGKFKHSLQG